MADTSNLTNFLGDIADAIRTKKETTEEIPAANFDTEILSIETGIDTSDATATTDDILNPKTAYVNGQKLIGNIIPTYKVLDVSEYHDSTPDWQKDYTMYDMINVQDYTIVMGLNGGIFYFTVLKNNTEYIAEFQLPLSGNFNDTNIHSCAIQLESMSDNQMNFVIGVSWSADHNVQFKRMRYDIDTKTFEVYNDCTASLGHTAISVDINRIIRDDNTPNVFYVYCPDSSISAEYARLGMVKIIWTETSGSINWVKTERMNIVERGTSYPLQQIGDGDTIVVAKNVVSVDTVAMTIQVESSEPFFISHNLKYMIYDNAFYKITDTTSVKNMFSKKVFVSELGVTSSGIISFSENDTYIIVPTSQTLYVFKIEDDNIAIVQNFPIAFVESKPLYSAYNFLVKDNTSSTYHLLYCNKNQQALVAMKRDEQDYFSTYDATAIESEILYGKIAYGQTGKVQGTMPNNGALTYIPSEQEQTIPLGYTSGGTVKAIDYSNTVTPVEYTTALATAKEILTGTASDM